MSIVKRFMDILYKKYILFYFLFFADDFIIDTPEKYMYCEHFRELEQTELVENLSPVYLPYRFLHNLQPLYCEGKSEKKKSIFLNECNKNVCVSVIATNGFAVKLTNVKRLSTLLQNHLL